MGIEELSIAWAHTPSMVNELESMMPTVAEDLVGGVGKSEGIWVESLTRDEPHVYQAVL